MMQDSDRSQACVVVWAEDGHVKVKLAEQGGAEQICAILGVAHGRSLDGKGGKPQLRGSEWTNPRTAARVSRTVRRVSQPAGPLASRV